MLSFYKYIKTSTVDCTVLEMFWQDDFGSLYL